ITNGLGDIRHMAEAAKRRRVYTLLIALFIAVAHRPLGRDRRGADRIDPNVLRAKFRSCGTGDAENARLDAGIDNRQLRRTYGRRGSYIDDGTATLSIHQSGGGLYAPDHTLEAHVDHAI